MIKKVLILLLTTLPLFSDAILTRGYRESSDLDKMPKKEVRDTLTIPQSASSFSLKIKPMSYKEQQQYEKSYNQKFFKPWSRKKMGLSYREKSWQLKFSRQRIYQRNGQRISREWFRYQIKNSNFKAYESLLKPAITLRHCDLKIYPTSSDFYYNPKRTGEGFPFDYNQNSSFNINTPLMVSHYSKDKKWLYVRSGYAYGWLPIEDVAFVNWAFIKRFKSGSYAVTIQDNLSLKNGTEQTIVKLGTLFPIDRETKKYLIATKDSKGYAKVELLSALNHGIIAKKPIPFNKKNVALIANQLIGEPYGWGGKLEARDCSSLTRDFFAPFGIFLRRNSYKQARDSRRTINLKRLSLKEKKRIILKKAKPFRSLLYVRGHITLYLGSWRGEPVMLHNYWGARLKSGKKLIFGRAIITSTEIGKERADIRRSSMLIKSFKKIINF
jgi:hypothetical protein